MRVWTGASNGAGGASQPTVRVKWDDGSVADTADPPQCAARAAERNAGMQRLILTPHATQSGEYHSGMTISRGALARNVHPDYETWDLERWLDTVEWGPRARTLLSTQPVCHILRLGPSDLVPIVNLLKNGSDDDQGTKASVAPALAGRSVAARTLQACARRVLGSQLMTTCTRLHAMCSQALAARAAKRAIGAGHAVSPVLNDALQAHTRGPGHDFQWKSKSGSSLPLQVASVESVCGLRTAGDNARVLSIRRTEVTNHVRGGVLRGGLVRRYPFTCRKILSSHRLPPAGCSPD